MKRYLFIAAMVVICYPNDVLSVMTIDGNTNNDQDRNSISFHPLRMPRTLNVSREPSNFHGKWKLTKALWARITLCFISYQSNNY